MLRGVVDNIIGCKTVEYIETNRGKSSYSAGFNHSTRGRLSMNKKIKIRNEEEAERFDRSLECLEKKYQPRQEEFYIHSHSIIQ